MADNMQQPQLTDDEQRLLDQFMSAAPSELSDFGRRRRDFLKMISIATGGLLAAPLLGAEAFAEPAAVETYAASLENTVNVGFSVNGTVRSVAVDSRMTLLDTLRERLDLTGTKKGCDHGQCGACTVHLDGQSALSCLTLAVMSQGKAITTIEGIASGDRLHPVQAAFIKHDAFQCGYCTPGQIMAATALLRDKTPRSPVEIREAMSGNLCRCAAYPNIIAAIQDAQTV